jgi:predicted MPP superfamily phosphohydrolase
MSLDLALDRLLAFPVLVGHAALWVYLVNVSHALGWSHIRVKWLTRALMGAWLVLACVLVGASLAAGPWENWSWVLRGYALTCLAAGLVVLPVCTALRGLRRSPSGISGHAIDVDLAATEGVGREAFIGTGRHAWMLRLPGNEALRLRKAEWEVAVPNLPVAWDGLSVVHLTDLHFAPCFRRAFFEAIADEAAAWDADLVALTGDLVDHDAAIDWIEPVLARVQGRLGSFAILGNHDLEHYPERVRQAVGRAGFTDLEGRWSRLEHAGSVLAIGGTSFPWGPRLDPREMPDADFRLLLSHSPDQFARAGREGIDLVLAGHNHGGQVRLPLIGPVLMPSRYSRRFDRGFFQRGRTLMYVGQGIGGQHPIRYGGCLPELTRFVLRVPETSLPSAARRVPIAEPAGRSW